MTNITGKIYQMKNADGTENRFPRTVIEAVLGLSSYLQDQFSSLADIYMPIEGIYEAFTGQEFVYRKGPNTIKAKSLTLDRIQGKSLAWNQLVKNGNFANTSGWAADGCTVTVSNNEATIANAGVNGAYYRRTDINFVAGHKYLVTCDAKSSDLTSNYIMLFDGTNSEYLNLTNLASSYKKYGFIKTINKTTSTGQIQLFRTISAVVGTVVYKNVEIIDLTLLYGSEISGMTDAEILTKFESEYPGYHDYSAGKLISNDAEAVETTGVNQFDESTLILNKWRDSNNVEQDIATRRRSDVFFRALSNIDYYIKGDGVGAFSAVICWYDSNKAFISGNNCGLGSMVTSPDNAAFFRISSAESDTPIIVNLSNPAINGQYFPYKKNTLPLNLGDFWVKDGQGNQVHITGGLKSAGSVKDEIVGNKYIKRVGSVDLGTLNWARALYTNVYLFYASLSHIKSTNSICSKYPQNITATSGVGMTVDKEYSTSLNTIDAYVRDDAYTNAPSFKTAMSGVMLYYELATPVEYELVEPLIYTTKAGTTEQRISPNSDGLSAPFYCDMTYSANENNDAGNAQYAATAGRLLNTHKIWGQDFNGTGDITGELAGVTNLTASGIITGSRLVSTVATGTAPLTVASTTMVQNLVAEKASKLLTARTIWGQSFDGSGNISGAISNITTISASGLATISGGIALGTSTKAQAAKMVWDEINNAWHLQGNLYADGFVSAYGTNESEALEALKAWVTENFEPKQS